MNWQIPYLGSRFAVEDSQHRQHSSSVSTKLTTRVRFALDLTTSSPGGYICTCSSCRRSLKEHKSRSPLVKGKTVVARVQILECLVFKRSSACEEQYACRISRRPRS